MTLHKTNIRTIILILMIVAAAAMRLLSYKFPYLSNFTPVGAIALFGGAYFADKWKAYVVVLLTLFTSDVIINYLYTSKWVLYYSGSIWVYLTFALMVLTGSYIKKISVASVGIASLIGVLVHWLIVDLTWLYSASSLYPHTLYGYGQALVAAIPFEMNMVYGDLLFCTILFGGFEFAKAKYTFLRNKREVAI